MSSVPLPPGKGSGQDHLKLYPGVGQSPPPVTTKDSRYSPSVPPSSHPSNDRAPSWPPPVSGASPSNGISSSTTNSPGLGLSALADPGPMVGYNGVSMAGFGFTDRVQAQGIQLPPLPGASIYAPSPNHMSRLETPQVQLPPLYPAPPATAAISVPVPDPEPVQLPAAAAQLPSTFPHSEPLQPPLQPPKWGSAAAMESIPPAFSGASSVPKVPLHQVNTTTHDQP